MENIEGWNKEALGRIAYITMGQSPDSKYYSEEKNGLPFLQGCAEFTNKYPKHVLYCSQTKKVAKKDAILFSVRAPVGRINIADQDYIIGRGLAAISGSNVDHTYLEHYLKHEEANFRNASQGSTFEAINSSELNKWPIEYPLLKTEQAKIAEILSTVDRAIEQTEALIAKQQRIKTGLMQDLLTRGIDKHGNLRSEKTHKFKDSLLGRIPVEWNVQPLSELAHVDRGKFTHRPRNDPHFYGGEFPFIQTGDVTSMIGRRVYTYTQTLNARGTTVSKEFPRGTIAITIAANIADTAILGIPMYFPDSIVGAVVSPPNTTRFIELMLRRWKPILERLASQSAQKNINLEVLRPLLIPIPGPEEQQRIGNLYNRLDINQERMEQKLLKLRSLKTALMQDLLTGKKRVIVLS